MAESRRAIGQFHVEADDPVAIQLVGEVEEQLAGRFREYGTPEAQLQVRIRAVFTTSSAPTGIVLVAAIAWPESLLQAVVVDFEMHEDSWKAIARFVDECVSAVDDMTAPARAARDSGSHGSDMNHDEDEYDEDYYFYEDDHYGQDGLDSSAPIGPRDDRELDDLDPIEAAAPLGTVGDGPLTSPLFTVAEAELAEIRAILVPESLVELRDLVARSYSLSLAEKREMTRAMPGYDDERIEKLRWILVEEQEKFAALNDKHLARIKELARKNVPASAENTLSRRRSMAAGVGRGSVEMAGELQDVKRIFDEARRAVKR